jgi:uncharacterized membrane protein
MPQETGAEAIYQHWVGLGADTVEATAVVLLIVYILSAIIKWLVRPVFSGRFTQLHYESLRRSLGRAILLGLEILIAADVIRTAALDPTLQNFEALGVLVIVRTFLSWSIVVEIEGRWPWQSRAAVENEQRP